MDQNKLSNEIGEFFIKSVSKFLKWDDARITSSFLNKQSLVADNSKPRSD